MKLKEAKFIIKYKEMFSKNAVQRAQQLIDLETKTN